MTEFENWWMLESKIPYRDKREIAKTAWLTALDMAEKECYKVKTEEPQSYSLGAILCAGRMRKLKAE